MKKVLTIIGALAFLLISTFAFAQAPQKFNYQGIARDAKGNPMSKQTLALKLSVLPTSDATVPEYEETQLVTTNEFGLYTLQIGNGTAITGEMKTVKWETGNKYIKVAIDPNGGTNYVDAGTNQLLSVPYALYADKAGESRTSASGTKETRSGTVSTSAAGTGTTNYLAKFTGANTIYNSQIFDNGSQIGIGTTSPSTTAKLHIASVTGTQPLILESPQGVHNLIREAGANRGYFGSYIGSGAPYPTPAGTSNEDFDIGTSGANPTGKLHLATQTTPRLTIDNVGKVGIGTTSPTRKMQIELATSYDGVKLCNSTTGIGISQGYEFGLSGNDGYVWNWGAGKLNFGTSNAFRMVIAADGKVGIGSTTPAYKLDVASNSGDFVLGRFKNSSTSGDRTSMIRLENGNTTPNSWQMGVGGTSNGLGLTSGQFYLERVGGGAKMVINTDGEVGFGTTTPSYNVDIQNAGSGRVLNVQGTGDLTTGQTMNISRDSIPGVGNDMLQISVPASSPDGFQFIECDRGGSNQFVVDGNGTVTFLGPLKPNNAAGSAGNILTSAGSTAAPTWQDPKNVPGATKVADDINGSIASSIPATASTWTLFGPQKTVTLTANQRVIMVMTASLGKTVAGSSSFRLDVGYRASTGTAVTNGSGGSYLIQTPSIGAGSKSVYTMTGTIKPGAGTWVIGSAVYAPLNYFNSNDYVNGYYMIVNE